MYFLLAGLGYSPQTGPWVQMQYNVCSPTPREPQCTVISEPPAAGHCYDLRVLQTEGRRRAELVLNNNSFTDTFHTLPLCSLHTDAWASHFRDSLWVLCTYRFLSISWQKIKGATVTSSGCKLSPWGVNCDHLLFCFHHYKYVVQWRKYDFQWTSSVRTKSWLNIAALNTFIQFILLKCL